MTKINSFQAVSIIALAGLMGMASFPMAFAKIRPVTPWKPRSIEANFVKGVSGNASLTVQQSISTPPSGNTIQFQDGKLVENVDFYKSPRCYLHMKRDNLTGAAISSGKTLKITKIDNIYSKGSVHVTFWFEDDSPFSDLACITNNKHTLTSAELKETLGQHFQVSFTKSIEKEALFNTAPLKNPATLSENAPPHYPMHSARIILE